MTRGSASLSAQLSSEHPSLLLPGWQRHCGRYALARVWYRTGEGLLRLVGGFRREGMAEAFERSVLERLHRARCPASDTSDGFE